MTYKLLPKFPTILFSPSPIGIFRRAKKFSKVNESNYSLKTVIFVRMQVAADTVGSRNNQLEGGGGGGDGPVVLAGMPAPMPPAGGAATGSNNWIQRTRLVDSRTSVTDVKFAPRNMGLMLATCSADGIVRIYEATDVMNLSEWSLQHEIPCKVHSCFFIT